MKLNYTMPRRSVLKMNFHADKMVSEWIKLGWTEPRGVQIPGKKSTPNEL